jgi:hypothetical protein
MTSLADDLVPDQLWALVAPCCQPRLGPHTAAGIAPSPIALLRRDRAHGADLHAVAATPGA